MGRKPSINAHLPPRMRARRQRSGTVYYYYDTGSVPRKEIPLGSDYILAVQQWSKLHLSDSPALPTVGWAIAKYLSSDDYTSLGTGTQTDYKFALDKILEHFGDAPLEQVKPPHIVLYIEHRGKESKHRALRERSVFSMLFRWCMARGYCSSNPCAPVKTKRLPGRKKIVISDDMYHAVYSRACQPLREAMDLAFYIGQRPGDILGLTEQDIKNGLIEFSQNKTGEPMRIAVQGDLKTLIDSIKERKKTYPIYTMFLLVDDKGKKMTKAKLRTRFEKARNLAGYSGGQFQFRDLRRKSGTDLRDQKGIEAAQDLLGHRDIRMTEHYTGAKGKIRSAIPCKPASNGRS